MRHRSWPSSEFAALAFAGMAVLTTGCSCGGPAPMRDGGADAAVTSDAGPADAGQDAGPADAGQDAGPADAGPVDAGAADGGDAGTAERARTIVFQTAAGGTASGPGHVVRFSVGAPQPMGRTTGGSSRALLGPGAAR